VAGVNNPLNEEAIEAAVDQATDHVENDPWFEDKAHDVGLTLSDFMKRVANEIEARGS
jgi:flavin-binding protein dodecin